MARVVIFLTGAVTLCLQLIASRVMTPFFGVSLLIWTGILSVTLLCLALGYGGGGRFCLGRPSDRLAAAFRQIPAWSGIWLVLAVLIYPVCLGPLAQASLAGGAFLAALLLLAVPLVLLSALNPLLVALEASRDGDGGAGQVFFISTMGSVAGVLVAAFAMIPHLSSRHSLLLLAVMLCLCSLPARGRTRILALCGLLAALVAGVLDPAGRAMNRLVDAAGRPWSTLAAYPSAFGGLKVVEVGEGEGRLRALFNDGLVQNAVDARGRPALLFTHALEAGAFRLVPNPRRALVLGLGVGVIPTALEVRGARVDVVEINPAMLRAAAGHFGFQPGPGIRVALADARTWVRHCPEPYDLVFIDLFSGDGMPEHLATAGFFADVRACLTPQGVVAMNAFLDTAHPQPLRAMEATLAAVAGRFARMVQPHAQGQSVTNAFLFWAAQPRRLDGLAGLDAGGDGRLSAEMAGLLEAAAASLAWLEPGAAELAGAPLLTDENNPLGVLAAPAQMAYRRRINATIPDPVLVD